MRHFFTTKYIKVSSSLRLCFYHSLLIKDRMVKKFTIIYCITKYKLPNKTMTKSPTMFSIHRNLITWHLFALKKRITYNECFWFSADRKSAVKKFKVSSLVPQG